MPNTCRVFAPMMATAMARSHMRIRPQLPMLTTSETAPMVQKLVLLATAPKIKARPKPLHATRAVRLVPVPMNPLPRLTIKFIYYNTCFSLHESVPAARHYLHLLVFPSVTRHENSCLLYTS